MILGPQDLAPQPGPQTQFCSSPADITIMGGAAYVGKTWAEVYLPLADVGHRAFTAAIYRQFAADIWAPGGLWDEASKSYPAAGGLPNRNDGVWRFPSGASVKFTHQTTSERVKGAQITLACFDELTHFDEHFFWSVYTRVRSTAKGLWPRVRATTNPDAESWVADFLEWWIDQDPQSPTYGLPLPERAGKIRWLFRDKGVSYWGSSPAELLARFPQATIGRIKSVQFIPGRITDNKIGLELTPGYEGQLASADQVSVARLLDGNWKVKAAAGALFKGSWFEDAPAVVAGASLCRGWDLAATKDGGDYTVGVLLAKAGDEYYVLDVVRDRLDPGDVERLVQSTARKDGKNVTQCFAWERAGAGKSQEHRYITLLDGWNVTGERESGPPQVRAAAFSAQAKGGRVKVVSGLWTRPYIAELEAFPHGKYDDQVAATLIAYRFLSGGLGLVTPPTDDLVRLLEEGTRAFEPAQKRGSIWTPDGDDNGGWYY